MCRDLGVSSVFPGHARAWYVSVVRGVRPELVREGLRKAFSDLFRDKILSYFELFFLKKAVNSPERAAIFSDSEVDNVSNWPGWGPEGEPPGWKKTRTAVMRRARGHCEGPGCGVRVGTRGYCDHVVPRAEGGGHEMGNLQWLCFDCHHRKTRDERARGRQRRAERCKVQGVGGTPPWAS